MNFGPNSKNFDKILWILDQILWILDQILWILDHILCILDKILCILDKILCILHKVLCILDKILCILHKILCILDTFKGFLWKTRYIFIRKFVVLIENARIWSVKSWIFNQNYKENTNKLIKKMSYVWKKHWLLLKFQVSLALLHQNYMKCNIFKPKTLSPKPKTLSP